MSHLTAPVGMARSVSVPGAADSGIESSVDGESTQHSFFSPTAQTPTPNTIANIMSNESSNTSMPPVHPYAPSATTGHSHHTSASLGNFSYAHEPQTPNESNTQHVANLLLANGAGERRGSKTNLRLQSQAPSKLSSPAMSVPSVTLLAPASPMTPAGFGGLPPPNTPLNMSNLDLLAGGDPVTPLFDQPFTPLPVPMSPMLPHAPPSSPFPALSLNSSANPSPLITPLPSPHGGRYMHLPVTMSGVDVLARDSDGEDSNAPPPPVPADAPPEDEDDDDDDDDDDALPVPAVDSKDVSAPFDPPSSDDDDDTASVDATNTAEFEVPSQAVDTVGPMKEDTKVLLHRSRLGRLSIVHREDLQGKGLLSPQASSSSLTSPTAIANMTEEQLAKHSLTHGPTVTAVQRLQHIAFDPNEASSSMQNIPPEWREALKSQFGIPATLCQSVKVDGYTSRIPLILVRMHEYLKRHHALESQVGIFRLAPDSTECARLKAIINENVASLDTIKNVNDMNNCVANLIKVWFRDLPVALFQSIPPESLSHMSNATTNSELESIVQQHLREPSQSVFRWLLDLACDVTMHSDVNKMVAKNVSICISPNLYKPPTIKPNTTPQESLKIMNQCKYYTQFLELCIGMREVQRGQKKTSCV